MEGYEQRHRTFGEILRAAQQGDDQAFESLIAALWPDLRRVIGRMLDNHRLVDTVLQDVVVRVFVQLPRFAIPADVSEVTGREYLRRWATNLARNHTRNVNRYGWTEAERWVLPRRVTGRAYRQKRDLGKHGLCSLDDDSAAGMRDPDGGEPLADSAVYDALRSGRRHVIA